MTEFIEIMKATPSYDERDEPFTSQSKGACGVRLWFILKGPKGSIVWELMTSWMANAIRDIGWNINSGRPPMRTGAPGVDDTGGRPRSPTAGPISLHCAEKLEDYWYDGSAGCEWLDGRACYGDSSYLAGDRAFAALTEGGSEAVFAVLKEFYESWIEGADE